MQFFAICRDAWVARLRRAQDTVERHPRRIAAGVGTLLLGSSVTAFGLAEYGPQPALPPVIQIVQPVSLNLGGQLQGLDALPRVAYATTDVRRDDTVESLLHRLGVTDPAQTRQLAHNVALRQLLEHPRQAVDAQVDGVGRLLRLDALLAGDGHASANADQQRDALQISARTDGTLHTEMVPREVQSQVRVASGVVTSTLFAATDAAGLPDALAMQMVNLFSGEVDFRRELRPGDRFAVVYRVEVANGQTLGVGRILAAQVDNRTGRHAAVWFAPPNRPQDGAYYTPSGGSLARSFLLSPLPYDRLTSGYGWRISPIFHRPEFHLGIDLAIPVGTPVRTVADGRVVFAGTGTGYGKYVKVAHPGGFASLYSHLSRFEVHVGQTVKQGEVVALSGNTGWSTGPHLYYQFFVNGKPVNPLDISQYTPRGRPLPAAERSAFGAQVLPSMHLLALLPGQGPALADAARTTQASGRRG